MRNIDTKTFDEWKVKHDPKKKCNDDKHIFRREIYNGTATGDYICEKCFFVVNECDKEKYGF